MSGLSARRASLLALPIAALALLGSGAATASAGTVKVDSGPRVEFVGLVGEVNTVTVSQSGASVVVTDTTTPVTPLAGCASLSASTAVCTAPEVVALDVGLGDMGDTGTFDSSVGLVGAGSASMDGEGGDDVLTNSGAGLAFLAGGSGADVLSTASGEARLSGGAGADSLSGGPRSDSLDGGADPDVESGGAGDDDFDAGSAANGADSISGGPGFDDVYYGSRTSGVTVTLDGAVGDGQDCPGASCENDQVGADVEAVTGSVRDDVLIGSASPNDLTGSSGDDVIDGGDGFDRLDGGRGADRLDGGGGPDVLEDGLGADTLDGGPGDDELGADPLDSQSDVASGGGGEDSVDYSGEFLPLVVDLDGNADDGVSDPLGGGAIDNIGTDVEDVTGGSGADVLTGGGAANELTGGPGPDRLNGGGGADGLHGGADNDTLTGAKGRDLIEGQGGADRMLARDSKRDEVSCGGSRDRVKADRSDRTRADCEKVSRPRRRR